MAIVLFCSSFRSVKIDVRGAVDFWPSGLRRYVQVVFLVGVGSNPTGSTFSFLRLGGLLGLS